MVGQRKLSAGFWGWVGLVGYIVVVDSVLIKNRKKSLSEVMGMALKHPAKRLPLMTIWFGLTLHLFAELLPEKMRSSVRRYDPIGNSARGLERIFDVNNIGTIG